MSEYTSIAQYAAEEGPTACERPPHDSSPNGMAFGVGLWASEHGETVYEVAPSRGYSWKLNRDWKLRFIFSPHGGYSILASRC